MEKRALIHHIQELEVLLSRESQADPARLDMEAAVLTKGDRAEGWPGDEKAVWVLYACFSAMAAGYACNGLASS